MADDLVHFLRGWFQPPAPHPKRNIGDFADRIDIGRTRLYNIRKGTAIPTPEESAKIAAGVGLPVEDVEAMALETLERSNVAALLDRAVVRSEETLAELRRIRALARRLEKASR